MFNESNSLKYRTRRNKKTDLTEYYNLIYEYKNDCLTAAIQYNKDYYSDKDLKPNEEIFFSISIVPFSKINSQVKKMKKYFLLNLILSIILNFKLAGAEIFIQSQN